MITVNKIYDVIKLAQIKEVTYNENSYPSYGSLNLELETNLENSSYIYVKFRISIHT